MLSDEIFMNRALQIARFGVGTTYPNPMVGAVLVYNGEIISEGWHVRPGQPHAEINCFHGIENAFNKTLYITLEPCSTYGRTPPCTDRILIMHPERVVISAIDPNPLHQGKGIDILLKAGIVVDQILEEEGKKLLEEANFLNRWSCDNLSK